MAQQVVRGVEVHQMGVAQPVEELVRWRTLTREEPFNGVPKGTGSRIE